MSSTAGVHLSAVVFVLCAGCVSSSTPYPLAPHSGVSAPIDPIVGSYTAARRPVSSGSETRFAGRLVYTGEPSGDAALFGDGTGGGISVLYRGSAQAGDDIDTQVIFEQTRHRDSSSAAGMYRRAMAGFRWLDPYGSLFESFLCVGASYNTIDVSGGSGLTAGGMYVGVGIEVMLGRAASMYAEAMLHNFWSDDGSTGQGQALSTAFGLGLRF